jgi:hypothetical protein
MIIWADYDCEIGLLCETCKEEFFKSDGSVTLDQIIILENQHLETCKGQS